MLSKKEKIFLNYIFNKCTEKESVLITPEELQNELNPKYNVNLQEVSELVNGLVLDNYITMILSDKKGKPIYCISLNKKGESYLRDQQAARKNLMNLIVRTVLLAILSTAVGLVLKAIF